MKIFFTRRNIAILAVALFIAALAIASVNTGRGPGVFTNGLSALTYPLKSAAASVARVFESIYGYMYEYELVVRENEDLKSQIADLRQKYRESTDLAEENARLYELLNLADRRTDFAFDTATIIQWSASNWSSAFTIDRGSLNSDVQKNDPVITETGVLIGRVSEVGTSSSVCVSVADTTFFADALVGELGARGSARGDFSLMRDGMLKLSFLTDETAVLVGDIVVTSGRGGVFPKDLIIGAVTGVRPEGTGLGVYAIVEPAAELRQATYVYVVTDFSAES